MTTTQLLTSPAETRRVALRGGVTAEMFVESWGTSDIAWSQEQRDFLAYQMRFHYQGSRKFRFYEIARALGFSNESSARTAVNRYAARNLHTPRSERGFDISDSPSRNFHYRFHGIVRPDRAVDTAPYPGGLPDLTFGVEIEFRGAVKRDVAYSVAEALGLDCVHIVGYHSNSSCDLCGEFISRETWPTWKVEHDASVDNGSSQFSVGGELVSPILRGQDGLDQITKVIQAVKDANGRIDRATGLHVHIGVGTNVRGIQARVVDQYKEAMDLLRNSVSPSRRYNHYCPIPTRSNMDRISEAVQDGVNPGTRYTAINFQNLRTYGTVEVRLHQGTLNAKKARMWVELQLGLVESARRGDLLDEEAAPEAVLDFLRDKQYISTACHRYQTSRYQTMSARS